MDQSNGMKAGQSDITAACASACVKYHFLTSARAHLSALSSLISSSAAEMNSEEARKLRDAIESANDVVAPYNHRLWK